MPFTEMTTSVSNHQAVVGDDPGLSGDAFKTLLDKAAEDIVDWANGTLLVELQSTTGGSSAAERIGSATITGVAGATPHAQMTDLKNQIDAVVLGTIPDDSLTDAKLVATAGQIKSRVAALQKFPTAGGTGTAITVDCVYFTLADGAQLTFVAAANNSGAATTLNAEGAGAKSVYKPGGTDAPTFVAGKAYTVWYDLSDDCFFLKASAEGTAVAANVLAGVTFSNDNDTGISGAMTDREGDNVALSSSVSGTTLKLVAPDGYYDGGDTVTITDADFVAAKIAKDINLFGITGTSIVVHGSAGSVTTISNTHSGGNTSGTTFVKIAETTFPAGVSGQGQVYYTSQVTGSGAGICEISFRKNGVEYYKRTLGIPFGSNPDNYPTPACVPGDVISIHIKAATGGTISVSAITFRTTTLPTFTWA